MASRHAQQSFSVGFLTFGHAAFAAALGLAASGLVLSGALGGIAFLESLHDPLVVVTLSLTVASSLAAGAGISAFILLSVERAEARVAACRRRPSP